MKKKVKLAVVAPSHAVPQIELGLGCANLKKLGFDLKIHPQVKKQHLYFAGTDEQRAKAFLEAAYDESVDGIYCARGGSGAVKLLPYFEKAVEKKGLPPRKVIAGYSDATTLLEYTRSRWGWRALHAPMPGMREFLDMTGPQSANLARALRGKLGFGFEKTALKSIGAPARGKIEGKLVGGNLWTWLASLGTPYEFMAQGKILFLEDTGEAHYRLERVMGQLEQSGGLKGVKAIVLGTFSDCEDKVFSVMAEKPPGKKTKPLRKKIPDEVGIRAIFGDRGKRLGIPVFSGLPVGHGGGLWVLPLGAQCEIGASKKLIVQSWE